jgi:hypothetical protein
MPSTIRGYGTSYATPYGTSYLPGLTTSPSPQGPTMLSLKFQSGNLSYTNKTEVDLGGAIVDTLSTQIIQIIFGDGTGNNEANRAYRDYRTLTDASITYTLSALPEEQGVTKQKFLFISVKSDSTGTLAVAPGATNGWPGLTIGRPLVPGSIVIISWPTAAGAAVVGGATDTITFTAVGTVTFLAVMIGVSE